MANTALLSQLTESGVNSKTIFAKKADKFFSAITRLERKEVSAEFILTLLAELSAMLESQISSAETIVKSNPSELKLIQTGLQRYHELASSVNQLKVQLEENGSLSNAYPDLSETIKSLRENFAMLPDIAVQPNGTSKSTDNKSSTGNNRRTQAGEAKTKEDYRNRKAVFEELLSTGVGIASSPGRKNPVLKIGNATTIDYGKDARKARKLREEHLKIMGKSLALKLAAYTDLSTANPLLRRAALGKVSRVLDDLEEINIFRDAFQKEWRRASLLNLMSRGRDAAVNYSARKIGAGLRWVGEGSGINPTVRKIGKRLEKIHSGLNNEENTSTRSKIYRSGIRNYRRTAKYIRNVAQTTNNPTQLILKLAGNVTGDIIRKASEVIVGVQTTSKLASALGNSATALGKVGSAFRITGSFIGNATNGLLPSAAIGLTIGGSGALLPALIIGGVSSGIAGVVNGFLSSSTDVIKKSAVSGIANIFGAGDALTKFHANNHYNLQSLLKTDSTLEKIATGSRQTYTGTATLIRCIDRGLAGAGIGSTLGYILSGFNPIGALAGSLIGGGAGIAVTRIGDAIANSSLRQAAAGNILNAFTKLPLDGIQGVVNGKSWIQTLTRIQTGRASNFEKQLYSLNNNGSLNLMGVFLNSANLLSYTLSSLAVNRALTSGAFNSILSSISPGASGRIAALGRLLGGTSGLLKFGFNAGTFIGSTVGSVVGAILAGLAGLNVGLGAAIGGTIGGITGTVVGGIAGVKLFGVGAIPGAAIGSFIGSSIGTFLGSLVDTLVSRFIPYIPSPLIIIQGIYDLYKWMTNPLRNLSDYAAVGMTAISLVTFLVAVEKLYTPNNSTANAEQIAVSANASTLVFAADATTFSSDYQQLKLNSNRPGNYYFSEVSNYNIINENSISFTADSYYWTLENIGSVNYSPETKSIVGNGANVIARVYNTASVAGASSENNQDNTDSADLNQPSQVSFCEIYPRICLTANTATR